MTQESYQFMPKPENRFKQLGSKICYWVFDQVTLAESFCIATSLHVLFFPVIWVAGWALPWPKSPVSKTIIEIDLSNWPNEAKTGKVLHVRPPELNK